MTWFLNLSLINANIGGLSEATNCRDHQDRQGGQIQESCAASWYGHFAPLQSKRKDSQLHVPLTLIYVSPCVTSIIPLHSLLAALKLDFLLRFLWDYENIISS